MHQCIPQKIYLLVLAVITCCFFAHSPVSAEIVLYRYKDDNDRLVLSNTIPPEHADKGYQVVDPFGRVLHNVLPAATPEQIAERKLQEAAKNRRNELARQQAEQDAFLKKLYSHPDDAVRAKQRKLVELDNLVIQKNIERQDHVKRLHQQESKAADAERSGKRISERMLSGIANLQISIGKIDNELLTYDRLREDTIAEFDLDIRRLKELKAKAGKKVALNIANLQGSWLIQALNGKPSADNDTWEFVGDKFYQSFNGRRLSPDNYKIAGNNIDLGYANIKVIEFGHQTMSAELAGFDYLLKKE